MIRILDERIYSDGMKLVTGACAADDVTNLPTAGIVTGSAFVAVDTGTGYLFDEKSSAWVEQ
ncbi:MAG: hypothetical protein J6Q14_01350 [Oscillospiraceae bacterium]|nr:hypothetical protein [Oscillospiraceae bacterium]